MTSLDLRVTDPVPARALTLAAMTTTPHPPDPETSLLDETILRDQFGLSRRVRRRLLTTLGRRLNRKRVITLARLRRFLNETGEGQK